MRRTLFSLLAIAAGLVFPAGALAAPVLVLSHDGRVSVRHDRFLPRVDLTPPPVLGGASEPSSPGALSAVRAPFATGSVSAGARTPKKPPPVTVASVLARLQQRGQITAAAAQQTLGAFDAALATESTLSGVREDELADVTTTVHDIAAAGQLSPSRLPAIIATLDANRRWWSSGSLLAYGQRVMFQGSELEWEYYPGQGIQLQVLGTFGEANGFYQAGEDAQLAQVLAEMIPLASQRGGGLTWEYYFDWEGGSPPWTSAMSQATALEALSHAYTATHDPTYLQLAARALGVFTRSPAQGGVAVRTSRGIRFLQYSFTPGAAIINAFLQTLIGLDVYAQTSGSTEAAQLFAQGNAEAEWEVPHYDTGAWSLYEPGEEDDLSYHELVTGFLAQLCTLTMAPVYCSTAQQFTADLSTPPVLADLTPRAPAKTPFTLRFQLSKISSVGVTIRRGNTIAFATSATFPYGIHTVAVPKLPAGSYTVTLTATDLAGNYARNAPAPLVLAR